MGDFLENLKKAADTGEFNSEAAKKILEINKLAETKLTGAGDVDIERLKESLEKRRIEDEVEELKDAPAVTEAVSEEDVLVLNSKYEKQMEQIKKQDMINAQLATLIEIEDMVKLSVDDMFGFLGELEARFAKEFETENPIFGDLYQKIESIKSKYNPIIKE